MGYPSFQDKHRARPVMTPSAVHAWRLETGVYDDAHPAPDGVVLTFQTRLLRRVADRESARTFQPPASFGQTKRMTGYALDRFAGRVAVVGGFGLGAPAAAIALENLIALGVGRFIIVGTAGGLRPDAEFGDVICCTGAIRDEGVSHHYVPSGGEALPSPELTRRLADGLAARRIAFTEASSWTLDAPYMETDAEVDHYRERGIACTEMEAAALFSVARFRGVEVAATFVISDRVTRDGWRSGSSTSELEMALDDVTAVAIDCLGHRPES